MGAHTCQVYCPKCFSLHAEECAYHHTINCGKVSIIHWHQINTFMFCALSKCQPRYINYSVKPSQQVRMYYLHFIDKKMEVKSCPKSHNQQVQKQQQPLGGQTTELPFSLWALLPPTQKLQTHNHLIAPKVKSFSVSWCPLSRHESVLFCLLCNRYGSCIFILQSTLWELSLLCYSIHYSRLRQVIEPCK